LSPSSNRSAKKFSAGFIDPGHGFVNFAGIDTSQHTFECIGQWTRSPAALVFAAGTAMLIRATVMIDDQVPSDAKGPHPDAAPARIEVV
jgi:hypothetical protein